MSKSFSHARNQTDAVANEFNTILSGIPRADLAAFAGFSDAFDETSLMDLSAHLADTGEAWAQTVGALDIEVQANTGEIRASTTGARQVYLVTGSSQDTATFTFTADINSGIAEAGLVLRAASGAVGDYIVVLAESNFPTAAAIGLKILAYTGGTPTTLDATPLTTNRPGPHEYTVTLTPTSIAITDGETISSATDNTHASQTQFGVMINGGLLGGGANAIISAMDETA